MPKCKLRNHPNLSLIPGHSPVLPWDRKFISSANKKQIEGNSILYLAVSSAAGMYIHIFKVVCSS